ncbi:phosphatase PAP2 family protein [Sulfurovum sp.]|uniref:phosphatase PAP2 family protein n=1 Tax=Sulfurovum sp. TaxID=1969726 RepID=UPI0025D4EA6D|nr:phosphatase PAP2 family protein [Sulfurovum sp.]
MQNLEDRVKKIFTALPILILANPMYAKSNIERIGDILSVAIPVGAYGATLYLDDEEGEYQFYKSYGTTLAATYALKYTVREKRPDSDNTDSFPSGHTSSAFSGAAFIHKRYGFEYAIIPYLGAIYTGYSRVHANRHYTRDVIAGALIGTASSWFFTSPYKNLDITPEVGTDYKGIQFNYKW